MTGTAVLAWLALPEADVTLPIEPFISVGGGILIAMVAGGFSLMGIWLKKRLDKLDDTAGDDPGVMEALAEIKRDIGGLRQENRTERTERMLLARTVSKLIEDKD